MMFDVVSLQGLEGKKVWMESSSLNDGATTNYQINDYFLLAIKSWSYNYSFHVQVEADTGANITLFQQEMLRHIKRTRLQPTNIHDMTFNGEADPCLGKAVVTLDLGNRRWKEMVFFSKFTKSNILSRGACMKLGLIPEGFPYEQVHTVLNSWKMLPGMLSNM